LLKLNGDFAIILRVPLLIGIVLLALGISLAVAVWSPAFVAALEVFAVVTLLFCGLIFSLVGYSALKAARSWEEALEETEAEPKTDKVAHSSVEL
jgi:hypothetical protein